ncbi:MAG: hypothetical protein GEU91_24405 [Rhizobiales bacterium]|nr:hypothetical protein [Hyphomicrobiales bacterium]
MQQRKCTRCAQQKPATREFFGSTPSGGLRGYCRTCMNNASRQYEANNKPRRRVRDASRGKTGPGARAPFDVKIKKELLERQGGVCPCCVKPISSELNGEVDHIIPLSRGGAHHTSNFMIAYSICNKEKHNKTLPEHWDWRVKVGLDAENIGKKYGLLKSNLRRSLPWQ